MLQSILKLSIINISVGFLMRSNSIRETTPPASIIVLNIESILFSGWGEAKPIELSLSMLFIFLESSYIDVAIWVNFNSMAVFIVLFEVSFIYFPLVID